MCTFPITGPVKGRLWESVHGYQGCSIKGCRPCDVANVNKYSSLLHRQSCLRMLEAQFIFHSHGATIGVRDAA